MPATRASVESLLYCLVWTWARDTIRYTDCVWFFNKSETEFEGKRQKAYKGYMRGRKRETVINPEGSASWWTRSAAAGGKMENAIGGRSVSTKTNKTIPGCQSLSTRLWTNWLLYNSLFMRQIANDHDLLSSLIPGSVFVGYGRSHTKIPNKAEYRRPTHTDDWPIVNQSHQITFVIQYTRCLIC